MGNDHAAARDSRILVTGLGWSGSSAVVDLLSGCSRIHRVPGEFDLFRRFGMIGDHVMARIEARFPSRACPPETSSAKSSKGLSVLRRQLGRRLGWAGESNSRSPLSQERARAVERMTCSFAKEIDARHSLAERVEVAVEWLDEVVRLHATQTLSGLILFDQPIVPRHHDGVWQKVFAPMHHIVVLRDPLDQLFEHYQWVIWPNKAVNLGMQDLLDASGGRGRTGVLTGMAERLLKNLEWVESLTHTPTSPLVLKFTEVVEDPGSTLARIESFVGESLGPNNWLTFDSYASEENIGVGDELAHLLDPELLRMIRTAVEKAVAASQRHESSTQ